MLQERVLWSSSAGVVGAKLPAQLLLGTGAGAEACWAKSVTFGPPIRPLESLERKPAENCHRASPAMSV